MKKKRKIWKVLAIFVGSVAALIVIAILVLYFSQSARSALAQTLVDYAGRKMFAELPPKRNHPQPVSTVKVRMRDGIELTTDLFLPKGKGPWPVILVRDPYGLAQYMHCTPYVRYGYACVHQTVRGRLDSGGDWYPIVNERNDGIDTIRWILEQPWQNRRITMLGGSYPGIVQWTVADELPPEVKTFVPDTASADVYHMIYHNGMFTEGVAGAWSYSLSQPWYKALSWMKSWRAQAKEFPASETDQKPFGSTWPAYRDYLMHPESADPYWQSPAYTSIRTSYTGVRVPVLVIGHTYDFFLPEMLKAFEGLPTRNESTFILAPGDHGLADDKTVGHPYVRLYADVLAWLDHFLKDAPLPKDFRSGYEIYIYGLDQWRHYDSWPTPSRAITFYLDGLSNAHWCDGGTLSNQSSNEQQSVTYRYNPHDPVPTRGGTYILSSFIAPTQTQEQGTDLCSRPDVLSFSSSPLSSAALISGSIRVKLRVASDASDTAFTVKLSEHLSNGRVNNIRDDISTISLRNGASSRITYQPGEQVEIEFNLIPIAWQLQSGSRLRLDVSSSNFPAFNVHPNRAGLWSAVADPVIANQTVYGGSIEIPIEESPNGNTAK